MNKGSMVSFHMALRKYGEGMAFEPMVVGERDYILEMEAKAIVAFNTLDREFGYNVANGGDASPSLTPAVAAKISAALTGRKQPASPALLAALARNQANPSPAMLAQRARNSERMRAMMADPEFIRKRTEKQRAKFADPEFRKSFGDKVRARISDPDSTFAKGRQTVQQTEGWRAARGAQMTALNADPKFAAARDERGRRTMATLHADPDFRDLLVKSGKAAMADPTERAKASERMKARHASADPAERAKLPKQHRRQVKNAMTKDLFE